MGNNKKDHLIRWEIVGRSNEEGGLGVLARNRALVGKWLRRFRKEIDSLWHLIIKSKYRL